jgi:hypothetical protein
MKKMCTLVKVMLLFGLLFTQNVLQAQKCCVECQADVKTVSDKQVLLEKIDIKEGTLATNVNTNVYVSYRSGDPQKFFAGLAIATAGVVVSSQLSNGNTGEVKTGSSLSPIVPLGVSIAALPSIWKNRPRNIPQAGIWIQHRDTQGKLLESWEQAISDEAKNSAELLTVAINKPLSAGTLEVYLQNGSKNEVYFWGYQSLKDVVEVAETLAKEVPKKPSSARAGGCSVDVYQRNGNRAAGLGGSSANATSSDDLEAQGYDLVYSIPFDCGTGKTVVGGANVPEGTNAYEAYQEFLRQANEYNSQAGSGGGNGSGTNGNPNNNPNATVDPNYEDPNKQKKCKECLDNANKAFKSGNDLLVYRTAAKMAVICHIEGAGAFAATEAAIIWLNATPPSAVVAQVISVLAGIGTDIYCLVETALNYVYEEAHLKTDLVDATNNCDRYCK